MSTIRRTENAAVVAPARRRLTWPAWSWSAAGVLVIWACLLLVRPGQPLSPMLQALSLAPFLVLVALGQMLVITLGAGNIDVSVGTIISMAAYVSINASGASPWIGVAAGALAGAAAGVVSVLAILVLKVPPIIATLATSLIVASVNLILNDTNTASVDPGMRAFVNGRIAGVSVIALIVVVLTIGTWFLLTRTRFGLSVVAIGQSQRAAERAGLRVNVILAVTYVLCAALAGLTGSLLGAYISPSTSLGDPYMLDSIAVVVVGGTLISGGRAVPFGAWTGAMFFVLLSSLLNVVGWSAGAQNVLKGALVVAVVLVSAKATGTDKALLAGWKASMTLKKKEINHG